jgi:Domain of unknown function (DUF4390)
MLTRISHRFIFLIFLYFLVFSSPLPAENAEIQDLLVTNNASHVLVYARVTNCFTRDIEAAILAGIPTTFTFGLELFQERSGWLDKKLIRITVRHTIKYDNVKKLFHVSVDGEKEATSFPDFESAKRAMADLNGVPVVPLETLKKNEYYYVLIKAKLDKVRLPLHMEYVFFFVSLWDFETDWYREGFFY